MSKNYDIRKRQFDCLFMNTTDTNIIRLIWHLHNTTKVEIIINKNNKKKLFIFHSKNLSPFIFFCCFCSFKKRKRNWYFLGLRKKTSKYSELYSLFTPLTVTKPKNIKTLSNRTFLCKVCRLSGIVEWTFLGTKSYVY